MGWNALELSLSELNALFIGEEVRVTYAYNGMVIFTVHCDNNICSPECQWFVVFAAKAERNRRQLTGIRNRLR